MEPVKAAVRVGTCVCPLRPNGSVMVAAVTKGEVDLTIKLSQLQRPVKASQESSTEGRQTETAGWMQCVCRPESGLVEKKPQQDRQTPCNKLSRHAAGRKVLVPARLSECRSCCTVSSQ